MEIPQPPADGPRPSSKPAKAKGSRKATPGKPNRITHGAAERAQQMIMASLEVASSTVPPDLVDPLMAEIAQRAKTLSLLALDKIQARLNDDDNPGCQVSAARAVLALLVALCKPQAPKPPRLTIGTVDQRSQILATGDLASPQQLLPEPADGRTEWGFKSGARHPVPAAATPADYPVFASHQNPVAAPTPPPEPPCDPSTAGPGAQPRTP